jgi:osmotically inducible lipoprotein OsmB|uniref:YMGG-like glycine zipper-containing protein n=1 Tax=Polynucleobacter sp. TaxID=2029855 RepID=UPI0040476CE3
MKKTLVILSVTSIFALSACSNMNDTQQRTLSGAGIGTAAGVGIGALTGGGLLWGAAGGAAIGALGGYVYDQHEKNQSKSSSDSDSSK